MKAQPLKSKKENHFCNSHFFFLAFIHESKFFYRSLLPRSQMSAHLVIDKQLTLNWFSTFLARKPLENQGQCVYHFFCRHRLDMNQFQCKKIVYFANCNWRDELKMFYCYSLMRRIIRCKVPTKKNVRQKRKPFSFCCVVAMTQNAPCQQTNTDIAYIFFVNFKQWRFLKVKYNSMQLYRTCRPTNLIKMRLWRKILPQRRGCFINGNSPFQSSGKWINIDICL